MSTDGEGERLDRFELIAELASGGMATVYLARLSGMAGFTRMYAIKRLHPHLAREPEFVEMFLDEARLAARIHHPHVVPILEIGHGDKGYYLVMEYIEGDTAARLFGRCAQHEKRVPWNVGVRIIMDTLAGLHAAHEVKDDAGNPLEVVHRDVSPQNVMVAIDGTSRLTDFGVARAATRLSTTRSGHLKGKLAYMAPEQARGETLDRRADVFAAGVMLWELLTFHRLFKSEGEAETLNRLLYLPIPTVREIDPTVPAELEVVAMRALTRNPDERYRSALEMSDALETAAIASGTLGGPREVAELLKNVLGSDLDAHREAVRQWMSRSEPNAAGASRSSAAPAAPRTNPPVSSVSSAVIQVPPPPSALELAATSPSFTPVPVAPREPAYGRAGVWGALAALAVVGLGLGAWRWRALPRPAPTPAPVTVAASVAPPAAVDVGSPAPAVVPASPASPAGAAPVAASPIPVSPASTLRAAPPDTGTAAPAAAPPRAKASRPPRVVSRPGAAPAAAPAAPASPPPAPAVPDDLSHNPYR